MSSDVSSDELKEIIQAGNDVYSLGYYGVAVATLFFYDFLLTLADEVKYAWRGGNSWIFALFLANRYIPMVYQGWYLYWNYGLPPSKQLCDVFAFIPALAFTGTTFLAQVVLTLRIYAITGKNRFAALFFGVVTASQFSLGIYWTAFVAMGGSWYLSSPHDVFQICVFPDNKPLEVGLLTMTLVYDLLAFLLVVYLVVKSDRDKVPMPILFKTIAEDATYYFLLIFSSHLVVELVFLSARPAIKLLPGLGTVVYVPVMITRLLLSVKKAGKASREGWSLGEPTTQATMRFAERRGETTTGDEINLVTFESTHELAHGQA